MTLHSRAIRLFLLCVFTSMSLAADDKPLVLAITPDGLSVGERVPLQTYLSRQMGRRVNLVIPNSYKEVVAGLGAGSIDFASLDAAGYVQAHGKYGVIPLVQRTSDLEFHSVFITGTASSIHSLRDLKGKQFAFGDVDSTSGHIIPYLDLKKAGINPDSDLKFRYSGAHPLTAKLVEAGVVDAGSLDELILKSLIDGGKLDRAKLRIFYTSKPFVGYVYVARKSVPEADREKFSKALESLKEGKDDQVLRVLRAKQFVPANDQEYGTIRQLVKEMGR